MTKQEAKLECEKSHKCDMISHMRDCGVKEFFIEKLSRFSYENLVTAYSIFCAGIEFEARAVAQTEEKFIKDCVDNLSEDIINLQNANVRIIHHIKLMYSRVAKVTYPEPHSSYAISGCADTCPPDTFVAKKIHSKKKRTLSAKARKIK